MNSSADDEITTATSLPVEGEENDVLSENLSRGVESVVADPNRSTLHTGSDHEGSAQDRLILDGALQDSPHDYAAHVSPGEVEANVEDDDGSVAENAAGAAIGTLSIVDPDAGDSHEITLSDDRFEVVGNEIRLKEGISLDHEAAAEIDLEVTVTDAGGLTTSESFTIAVEDVNEAPAEVALDGSTVAENAAGAAMPVARCRLLIPMQAIAMRSPSRMTASRWSALRSG